MPRPRVERPRDACLELFFGGRVELGLGVGSRDQAPLVKVDAGDVGAVGAHQPRQVLHVFTVVRVEADVHCRAPAIRGDGPSDDAKPALVLIHGTHWPPVVHIGHRELVDGDVLDTLAHGAKATRAKHAAVAAVHLDGSDRDIVRVDAAHDVAAPSADLAHRAAGRARHEEVGDRQRRADGVEISGVEAAHRLAHRRAHFPGGHFGWQRTQHGQHDGLHQRCATWTSLPTMCQHPPSTVRCSETHARPSPRVSPNGDVSAVGDYMSIVCDGRREGGRD
mmetsp:Transcript_6722/g.15603  ORF Transcript_6722/g.15603 Transcript_6722/m.15603 type:complete len:278 (-) Transcript_6722:53-886(-)